MYPVKQSLPWYYYLATFVGIVVLESIPRFLSEAQEPLPILPRLTLLILFFATTWFFTVSQHTPFQWSLLSSIFILDSIVAVTLTFLLFFQLYSGFFAYVSLVIILLRALTQAYLVSRTLPSLRGLVFGTGAVLLIAGELIILLA